eukprot:c41331_g1_i1 orf=269-448(+)
MGKLCEQVAVVQRICYLYAVYAYRNICANFGSTPAICRTEALCELHETCIKFCPMFKLL